jgi:hypothetical protein
MKVRVRIDFTFFENVGLFGQARITGSGIHNECFPGLRVSPGYFFLVFIRLLQDEDQVKDVKRNTDSLG